MSINSGIQNWQCPIHKFHEVRIDAQGKPDIDESKGLCPHLRQSLQRWKDREIGIGGHYLKGKREVVVTGFDLGDVIFQEVGSKRRSKVTKAAFRRLWTFKGA